MRWICDSRVCHWYLLRILLILEDALEHCRIFDSFVVHLQAIPYSYQMVPVSVLHVFFYRSTTCQLSPMVYLQEHKSWRNTALDHATAFSRLLSALAVGLHNDRNPSAISATRGEAPINTGYCTSSLHRCFYVCSVSTLGICFAR